jgi:hypothetical protein
MRRVMCVSLALGLMSASSSCTGSSVTGGSSDTETFSTKAQWSTAELVVSYTLGSDGTLLAFPEIINRSSDSLIGGISANCALDFKAYAGAERSGSPVWEPADGSRQVCPAAMRIVRVAPGDSLVLGLHIVAPMSEVMAARGPGTYYFSAMVEFTEPKFTLGWRPAGQVDLPLAQ